MTTLQIVFWVLLLDSLGANVVAWTKLKSVFNKFKLFKRYFPITRGWALSYLTLVLLIGYLVYFY